mmetsp:Transcript_2353/g.6283  ORF Transcript_2353/g.6283 Transcript_2353/m.6283 type:complete len:114 (+) Transcript_2353:639-980(+)
MLEYVSFDYGNLLRAISKLPILESLVLCGDESCNVGDEPNVSLNSEEDLLSFATGPVRRSLVTCHIQMFTSFEIDEFKSELVKRLLRCVKTQVEPSFEKQAVGSRIFCFGQFF